MARRTAPDSRSRCGQAGRRCRSWAWARSGLGGTRTLSKTDPRTRVIDAVELTRDLIRRPSVTPADAGAMDIVEEALNGYGFACRRMKFGEIENLYARYGV